MFLPDLGKVMLMQQFKKNLYIPDDENITQKEQTWWSTLQAHADITMTKLHIDVTPTRISFH